MYRALVDLIKGSRNITVQVKAASAIEYLAHKNINAQRVFLDLDAPKSLLRLLKVIKKSISMSILSTSFTAEIRLDSTFSCAL